MEHRARRGRGRRLAGRGGGRGARTGPPLVAVPFGTRNHFARDLGLDPDDPLAALAAFEGPSATWTSASWRAASSSQRSPSASTRASCTTRAARRATGWWRSCAWCRRRSAARGQPLALSFDVDGRHEERRALIVLVANNDYGGGSLAERERLDEGLLYVYVLEPVGRGALVALLGKAARGRPDEAEGLVEWTCERLRSPRAALGCTPRSTASGRARAARRPRNQAARATGAAAA